MRGFKNAIREVKNSLSRLLFFESLINTLLIFLVFLLISSLFNIRYHYAAGIAGVYLVWMMYKHLTQNKISMVEQKYPNLDEKLRTAEEYDTGMPNRVIEALQKEVISDLKKVEESSFISEKRIYTKSIAIVLLSFIIVFLAPITIVIPDSTTEHVQQVNDEEEVKTVSGGESRIRFAIGKQDSGITKISDEIYGKATIAQLGSNEIKIKIKPAGTELNIREIQEIELIDFSESYLETQPIAVSAASYQDEIPEEDLELVKNYFNKLAQT